jgi:hypothetical protein
MAAFLIRKVETDDAFDYAVNHIACWKAAYNGIIEVWFCGESWY